MKVSVIMPCYNSGTYLSACMDSVLAQDMQDFEVLAVDDGSVDDTPALLAKYAVQDARVRILSQKNSGVSTARNLALSHASGEWVLFVDSDDLLAPNALRVMLEAAAEDADMVVCAHETFDENGTREVVYPMTRWMERTGEKQRHAVACRLIEGDSVLNIMCNKLHRRSLLEKEKIRLVPSVAIAEDALFNLEAVLCGRRVVYVNRVTYRYRIHSQSAMQRTTGSAWQVHLPWLRAMREMLARRGLLETYYVPFFDSAVLRLYKDGRIGGVVRMFNQQARGLLDMPKSAYQKLSVKGKVLCFLCRSGAYPVLYPLIAPMQIVRRKMAAMGIAMRADKERPI